MIGKLGSRPPFAIFTLLYEPFDRAARRVKTAKGTAQGISLSGIVFPQPPSHNTWLNIGHKKTACSTGCGFARLLEFSLSVEKSIITNDGSCQAVLPASWPNQWVELTRGILALLKFVVNCSEASSAEFCVIPRATHPKRYV